MDTPSGRLQPNSTNSDGKQNIRYVEKRRTATCSFADRVARLSIDHYHALVPVEDRLPQTCLATMVSHDKQDELRVVSMGVGTKFLPEKLIQQETVSEQYGRRIRDCHAEVLARRGLKRQLAIEILQDLSGTQGTTSGNSILEHRTNSPPSALPSYQLREGVTLHLYTSSAPCGNATLKKFAKMNKEKFRDEFGPDEWPTESHDPIHGSSIQLGQFALLIKKDSSEPQTNNDGNEVEQVAKNVVEACVNIPKKAKSWPVNQSDDWAPPGMTIVPFRRKGSIHSCSDKIARWNILGLQGSLLSRWIVQPIHLSTITVGRKFSSTICRRALCCRMEADWQRWKGRQRKDPKVDSEVMLRYQPNHPSLLGTAVYMDESGTVETSADVRGQDVRFHSSNSFCWWRSKGTDQQSQDASVDRDEESLETFAPPERIDGSTGYLLRNSSSVERESSLVSTDSLNTLHAQILQLETSSERTLDKVPLSLSHLREWKQTQAVDYETVKEQLFRNHRIFHQWRSRYHV